MTHFIVDAAFAFYFNKLCNDLLHGMPLDISGIVERNNLHSMNASAAWESAASGIWMLEIYRLSRWRAANCMIIVSED